MVLTRLATVAVLIAAGPAFAATPSTKPLDKVLSVAIANGEIDFGSLRTFRADLDAYLKSGAEATGDQPLSFYLNIYNASVLADLVAEPQLPTRVTDIRGFFDKKTHKILGKDMTLNEVFKYVRDTFKDPRVHFALNVGAKGNGPFPARAFDEKTLNATLDEMTRAALDRPTGLKVEDARREILVPQVMDWYKADFQATGSVEAFLQKYVAPTKKAALDKALADGYRIRPVAFRWEPNAKFSRGSLFRPNP